MMRDWSLVCMALVTFIRTFPVKAAKVHVSPPREFLLDMSSSYLQVSHVILVSHENSSVSADDYANLLHNHTVFTSVFEWKMNGSSQEQFRNFIHVISRGVRRKIVFVLDDKSTANFLQNVHLMKKHLRMPCFYRWLFFDFEGVDISRLQSFDTSAVCWGTLFVTRKDNRDQPGTPEFQPNNLSTRPTMGPGVLYRKTCRFRFNNEFTESEDVRFSLLGPALSELGACILEEHLGDWSSSKGLSKMKPFKKRITDFGGRKFSGSFLNENPFYAESSDGDGYEGLEFDLLETLKAKLNFKVDYVKNEDGQFGSKSRNGTWSGYIGLISTGKVIFSISTLSISNRRMEVVDYSPPYLYGKLCFVVISPTLESRKYVLIKPLSPEVWFALVTTLILCTFVLYLITHSLPCKSGVRRAYNIWFLLRTLGQQGTPSPAPARHSIRFFISGWWFFIMVILWSYAGRLTSFMTYPGSRQAIDTLKKLQNALASDHIQYGTLKGSSYENFLREDMSEVNPIFTESLERNPSALVNNAEEGMEKVLQGKYAFVYMKAILKWFAATLGYDRFRFSKDIFSLELVGIAVQKCHPCKISFDHVVDRLEETGFFMKWYDDAFFKAKLRAPEVDIPSVRPLSLDDVQGAFYFLGICLLVATFVLLLEIAIYCVFCFRWKAGKKKK